jgi:hypothetical protein
MHTKRDDYLAHSLPVRSGGHLALKKQMKKRQTKHETPSDAKPLSADAIFRTLLLMLQHNLEILLLVWKRGFCPAALGSEEN